jgi:hypothetical protein
MKDNSPYDRLLIQLKEVNFADKYYNFCSSTSEKISSEFTMSEVEILNIITGYLPGFKYVSFDKSFCFVEFTSNGEIGFNLSLLYSTLVELSLTWKVNSVNYSNQITIIARDICRIDHPDFVNDPPYPKMAFVDRTDLVEILVFSIGLFDDCRHAIDKAMLS